MAELGEFAAWARRPAENVVVIGDEAARRSRADGQPDADGDRRLLRVPGAARAHARARAGRCRRAAAAGATSRSCTGSRAPAARACRCGCASSSALPRTLTLEQVAAVDRRAAAAARPVLVRVAGEHGDADRPGARRCATRTSSRGSGGSRSCRARASAAGRAARAARAARCRSPGELMRLWSDYMHDRVRRPGLRLRVREPVGGRDRPADQLRERSTS